MALTRKFLSALGIEADKVDEIIEAHSETVNALKAERDEARTDAKKLPELQKQLDEANEALEASKGDGYKAKYDELKAEYDGFKADVEAKALLSTKDKAYRQLLKDAGVSEKRIDAIMRLTDLKDMELDGEKLKDADKLTESIKSEWADYITSEGKQGAGTENPPEGDSGNGKKVEIPTIF